MKTPFIDRIKAEEIAAAVGTPYYVYDAEGIRKALRGLQKAFSWCDFKEYYAVKACPNPYILKLIREAGGGADCSSYTELLLAASVGFEGESIMFSSNVTPAEDFEAARSLGALINLDDITHIDFLEKHGGIPGKICLRYNPGGHFEISGEIMGSPEDAKYGMTREQIFEAVGILKEKGVKEFGLHAFLASNMQNGDYWPKLAEILFELAAEVRERFGVRISFVNLSGGIGIPYRPEEKPVDIRAVGKHVKEAFEKEAEKSGLPMPSIKAELGRYMTGPYGILVARVIHMKHIYREYAGLDACAANLMRPAMYGSYHHITVFGKENETPDTLYDVTGGLCENNDKFAVNRLLPKLEPGDLVAIHDAGAHGFSMGYNYNGKLRSAEVLLEKDGSWKLIRRAETPKDYFATFDFEGAEIVVKDSF